MSSAGPAMWMPRPEPRNSPTPMAMPMDIICMCRGLSPRASPESHSGPVDVWRVAGAAAAPAAVTAGRDRDRSLSGVLGMDGSAFRMDT
ncbi:hypothetical protein SANTM175S_03638 [Streptomyces antimycoticus]